MATNTYVALDKVTVGTATPSITFTGISGAYTDLVIVASIKADSTTIATPGLRFNSDTTSNYSATWLYGNGSTASSSRASNATMLYTGDYVAGVESGNFSTFISHIQNYSNATTYKTILSRNNQINASDGESGATVGLWRKTPEAITSITYTSTNAANFAVGSTFSLYGIAASSVGAKATGGIISSDSQYYYHTFLASGTFTPTQSLTCDYLVVAGGGAGGFNTYDQGGGGGGGGLRSTVTATGGGGSLETPLSLTATGYTVTVGAGGASNSSGSNSVFSTITSTGGGVGGRENANPAVGGSGGGGSWGTGGVMNTGAAGTTNQGYAGGSMTGGNTEPASPYSGAGGGGAGGVGASVNKQAATAGAGGVGVAVNITGSLVYYAGGGGGGNRTLTAGGAGGLGGGGKGNTENGTANTGGGGGGGGTTNRTGGSGIVIIRYLKA